MRSSNGPSKLFVGDIGENRKADLSRLFSKYGEISTIYVDEHKHFAFVEFVSSTDADRALKHTNNKTVGGSRLRVEYARSDKPSREHRRPISRERSPTDMLYSHLEVTANRLPPRQALRPSVYQHHPPSMMASAPPSRGRSLTPPSLKNHARLPSMHHLRGQDFYPPYHPPMYPDPAYYRAYGDPYVMQRLPPAPAFAGPSFISPPSSSSSRSYRHMYSSSDLDRYPSDVLHRRMHEPASMQRSRSRRRTSPAMRDRSRPERRRERKQSSPSPQRERGPRTPPIIDRNGKRSRSNSDAAASASDHKSNSSSSDEEKPSNTRRSQDHDSNRKHSKRKSKRIISQ